MDPLLKLARPDQDRWWPYLSGALLPCLPVAFVVIRRYLPPFGLPPYAARYFAEFACWAFGLLVLWGIVRFLHRRPLRTLLTTAPRFRWGRTWFAAGVTLGMGGLMACRQYLIAPDNYYLSLQWGQWIPALLFGLVFITLQGLVEQATYRTYCLQAFGLATRNTPVATLLTVALFVAARWHYGQANEGMSLVLYAGVGLLLSLTTLLDKGVELSTGIYLAHNLFSTLVVSAPSDGPASPSVFGHYRLIHNWTTVYFTLLSLTLVVGILALKYGWERRRLKEKPAMAPGTVTHRFNLPARWLARQAFAQPAPPRPAHRQLHGRRQAC